MARPDLVDTIDLTRYPLDKNDSKAYLALFSDKRNELNENQFCSMPEFLLESQRGRIVAAIEGQQENTHRADNERNIYLQRSASKSLPTDHPNNIFTRGCYNMMGAHLLAQEPAVANPEINIVSVRALNFEPTIKA
jgi:hypothetical protein